MPSSAVGWIRTVCHAKMCARGSGRSWVETTAYFSGGGGCSAGKCNSGPAGEKQADFVGRIELGVCSGTFPQGRRGASLLLLLFNHRTTLPSPAFPVSDLGARPFPMQTLSCGRETTTQVRTRYAGNMNTYLPRPPSESSRGTTGNLRFHHRCAKACRLIKVEQVG